MRALIRPRFQVKSLASRFGASVLAIAALAGMAINANASIVTTNTSIVIPNNFDGIYINLVTGAASATEISGFDINPYGGSNGLLFYWGGDAGSVSAGVASSTTGPYRDLAVGAVVSSASTFSQSANGTNNEAAAFHTSGTHHLGLRFMNEATGALNYGFLTLLTTGTSGFPATITGWSYENTGASIVVADAPGAAVPEPSTGLMMGLGVVLLGLGKFGQKRRNHTS